MNLNPVEFGFVAALEREVSGVVRGWQRGKVQIADGDGLFHYNQRAALVCAGTGVERAYTAAKVLIEKFSPRVVISIGFAGACVPHLQAGEVVVPATLLEASTGRTFHCSVGRGRLVTLDRVAGKALKSDASSRFGAQAVDMEAAGVALAAAECGREFAAIKVISDEAEDELGFVSDFVKPEGFEIGRFVAYIALRPQLWPRVAVLNWSSKLATAALGRVVAECINDWPSFSEQHSGAAAASLMKESC